MKRAQTAFGKKDMYTKFPRQMLRSRVVSEGVRTLWPLATSGMLELGEASAIQPEHNGPTLEATPEREALNSEVPLRAAAAPMPRGARVAERAPAYEGAPAKPSPERTDAQWRVWLDKLRAACEVLYHRSEVVEVAERPSVADALANGPEWVRREISAILAENYKRFPAEDEPADDLPEVEIKGEANVMAGDD
jgi:hypothetical protein